MTVDDTAGVVLRSLRVGETRITGGFWADRQEVNRAVTLPAAVRHLEEAGNFDNLRLAAGTARGRYRGKVFLDSDVYKWLEALAWEQGREPCDHLATLQDEATALVADAQAADGYLNSYVQATGSERFADLAFGHELYCAGHLIQAAVAQKRATGKEALQRVAVRMADLLADTFGEDRREGVPGHPEIEMALVELYRSTGHHRYLDLARYFIEARGRGLLGDGRFGRAYYQDRVPVRQARHIEGHAVRAMFLAAGASDVVAETGDPDLLDAALHQWQDMTSGKTYLTGGVGSRWDGESIGDPYELPADRAYCETCAAVGGVMWSWRMLLITGEARFADHIERVLYNAFAPGLSLDGTRFFYANTLQLRSDAQATSSRSPAHGRRPWYGTACCPPNIMRMLSSLDHYLATRDDGGVQLHQYADSLLDVRLADSAVSLRVRTGYPWNGRVDVEVTATPDRSWTLSLRIPAWCDEPRVAVGGREPPEVPRPGAYLRLRRTWRAGDHVLLDLSMPPRITRADERIDAVRGCVAVERGPLVYSFEQVDQPDGVRIDDIALDANAGLKAVERPDLLNGVTAVEAAGLGSNHDREARFPYINIATVRPRDRTPARLVAVPYYAWANRALGPMRVWVPVAPDEHDVPVPGAAGP